MKQTPRNRRKRLGQSLIEFTFVGIPLIFVLISIFEISRGMWIYHTLAYSVKSGVRFAAVHGINCVTTTQNTNSCTTSIKAVAQRIQFLAVGLDPNNTTLTFWPGTTTNTPTTCTLGTTCTTLTSIWPPYDSTGTNNLDFTGQPLRIDIRTPFTNAISMLFTGSAPVSFASGTLGASSQDHIQY